MGSVLIRLKEVLLLLIQLLLLTIFVGVLCLFFVLLLCNHLAGEERAGCFTLIAFLLPCGC